MLPSCMAGAAGRARRRCPALAAAPSGRSRHAAAALRDAAVTRGAGASAPRRELRSRSADAAATKATASHRRRRHRRRGKPRREAAAAQPTRRRPDQQIAGHRRAQALTDQSGRGIARDLADGRFLPHPPAAALRLRAGEPGQGRGAQWRRRHHRSRHGQPRPADAARTSSRSSRRRVGKPRTDRYSASQGHPRAAPRAGRLLCAPLRREAQSRNAGRRHARLEGRLRQRGAGDHRAGRRHRSFPIRAIRSTFSAS